MGITLAQFFSEGEQTMCLTQEEAQFLRNYQKLPPEVKQAVEQLVAASSKQ